MQLYRLTYGSLPDARWYATRGDAHLAAKRYEDKEEARIDLFDIPLDKANVLFMINGEILPVTTKEPYRTWYLTRRGGLKEFISDEKQFIQQRTDMINKMTEERQKNRSESDGWPFATRPAARTK